MRCMLINDLGKGGAEKIFKFYADAFENEIEYIVTIWPSNYNAPDKKCVHCLLKKKGFLIFDLFLAFFKLVLFLRKNNIRLVNSHLFWSNYINYFSSIFNGHKVIMTHCVSYRSKFSTSLLLKSFHYLMCKISFRSKVKHIFKSVDMRSEYQKYFKISDECVIVNPIDFDFIKKSSNEIVDFHFSNDNKYIVSVGRFHKTKNQKFLISLLEYLPDNYKLILIGEGPEFVNCKGLAKKLNLLSRVYFLGQINNPYPYYKRCDFYFSSSLSEGYPNALLEALALNCYPVVFDCPTGPKEILSLNYSRNPVLCNANIEIYSLGIIFKTLQPNILATELSRLCLESFVLSSDVTILLDRNSVDSILTIFRTEVVELI